jgi:hypothetical protein
MGRQRPTERDRQEAVGRLLSGLGEGEDVPGLARSVAELHPRNDTFPGEVFLAVARQAMDLVAVTADAPIAYEDFRERYLPECEFRGRENRKFRFVVLAAAAARGGLDPDLLDEVAWWQTDDFWSYALAATVGIIRCCAERDGSSVADFAARLHASSI